MSGKRQSSCSGLKEILAAPVPGKSKGIASRTLSVNAALQRKVISRLNGGLMWEHEILAAVDCPFIFFHGDKFKNLLGVFRIVKPLGGAWCSEFIRESVLLSVTRDDDFVER